ncbi:adenine nucleotide alpha hydrolase family protein [Desulfofundulus thermocisternus]|uniref:adenine nucleotide alpha hydrolase family protein n=1 Tax=Desulfofundulus thermocisternus TaxID=42471 RepID=UPI00217CF161|nr:adenine nucleotide alpha hydrolase family protein [Desulfofundulus thermocisternus]
MRRCIKCKGEPAIDLKSNNTAFCKEHFIEYFLRQVSRAIKKYNMFSSDERILVAVSGGKDSMALWDALLSLGYNADGLHVDLGIGEYSTGSRRICENFAASRGARLYILSLEDMYGTNMREIVRRTRRVSCSVCGTVKRYLMNLVVQQKGYRVVATGHNLDDETAALLGNLFGWQEGYLARQYPHLPSTHARLPAKVKPLVRLGELETETYCRLKGIDFLADDCPLARGATSLAYKELINSLEEKMPGTKQRFLFGFWDRGRRNFTDTPVELKECSLCGQPTTAGTCLFCRLMQKAGLDPLIQPQVQEM